MIRLVLQKAVTGINMKHTFVEELDRKEALIPARKIMHQFEKNVLTYSFIFGFFHSFIIIINI